MNNVIMRKIIPRDSGNACVRTCVCIPLHVFINVYVRTIHEVSVPELGPSQEDVLWVD